MKKVFAVFLSFALVLAMSTAMAAGKISVTQENFYALNTYSDYGYAFAKVTNVGNKAIKINAGILEIYDSDGENLTSTDYLNSYASYLEPDEYTYVYMQAKLEDGQLEKVDDYLLTITGKSDSDGSNKRLTVKDIDFIRNYQTSKYSSNDCGFFTITNDTDETVWNIRIVYALLDDKDNILYVNNDYVDSNKGLTPGSSMQFRETISDKFVEYYDSHDLIPTKIDVIAYIEAN